MNKLANNLTKIKLNTVNLNLNFNTAASLNAGKLWRMSVGLSKLQTAKGSLIDLPDYSFLGKN